MRKEDAIAILKTNIHRDIIKKWSIINSPSIIGTVFGIIQDIRNFTITLPETGITLPPPKLTIVNIYPAIFSGIITGCSILIGFFAVSAHNFRNYLQTEIDHYQEDTVKVENDHARLTSRKEEINLQEANSKKINGLKTESQELVELNNSLKECEELEELLNLNRDALAHQQEHIEKFVFTYLFY